MLNRILNYLFFRPTRASLVKRQFTACLQSELAEEFLELLLKLMSLMFCLDREFRRNILNFEAGYQFKSRDNMITVAVIFHQGRMQVREEVIDQTKVTVIFKDQRALMNFLLSPRQDVLQAVLNQEVTYDGNLNYLSKFAYLAKHLQLMVTGS